jgi:two-component system, chemotaxis family, protein-glutamate methylesterase/glutaminase
MSLGLRVLVVDDTVTYRKIIGDALAGIPGVEVVGTASNGRMALSRIQALRPDLITLDNEMPEMNGLEVLEAVRDQGIELGVIMVSAFTRRGSELTIRALELGAFDFITKVGEGGFEQNRLRIQNELAPMLRAYGQRRDIRAILRGDGRPVVPGFQPGDGGIPGKTPGGTPGFKPGATGEGETPGHKPGDGSMPGKTPGGTPGFKPGDGRPVAPGFKPADGGRERKPRPDLVLIGVSTGGPNALGRVIPRLPANLGVPVLIVQHMPPLFTRTLAESLDKQSALRVKEAEHLEPALPNRVYIAPGGKQMKISISPSGKPIIQISDDPPENNCKPSADTLFRSAAYHFPGRTCAVIMTGMGSDGTLGLRLIKRNPAWIIAQDEATCIVFGMPKEAIAAGVVDVVSALDGIAGEICKAVMGIGWS